MRAARNRESRGDGLYSDWTYGDWHKAPRPDMGYQTAHPNCHTHDRDPACFLFFFFFSSLPSGPMQSAGGIRLRLLGETVRCSMVASVDWMRTSVADYAGRTDGQAGGGFG